VAAHCCRSLWGGGSEALSQCTSPPHHPLAGNACACSTKHGICAHPCCTHTSTQMHTDVARCRFHLQSVRNWLENEDYPVFEEAIEKDSLSGNCSVACLGQNMNMSRARISGSLEEQRVQSLSSCNGLHESAQAAACQRRDALQGEVQSVRIAVFAGAFQGSKAHNDVAAVCPCSLGQCVFQRCARLCSVLHGISEWLSRHERWPVIICARGNCVGAQRRPMQEVT
jgi:hypothetical protein